MKNDFKCADPFCRHLASDHDWATGKCLKKPSGISPCSCDGLRIEPGLIATRKAGNFSIERVEKFEEDFEFAGM